MLSIAQHEGRVVAMNGTAQHDTAQHVQHAVALLLPVVPAGLDPTPPTHPPTHPHLQVLAGLLEDELPTAVAPFATQAGPVIDARAMDRALNTLYRECTASARAAKAAAAADRAAATAAAASNKAAAAAAAAGAADKGSAGAAAGGTGRAAAAGRDAEEGSDSS